MFTEEEIQWYREHFTFLGYPNLADGLFNHEMSTPVLDYYFKKVVVGANLYFRMSFARRKAGLHNVFKEEWR